MPVVVVEVEEVVVVVVVLIVLKRKIIKLSKLTGNRRLEKIMQIRLEFERLRYVGRFGETRCT